MNISPKSLFVAALVIVAGSIFLVSREAGVPVDAVAADAPAAKDIVAVAAAAQPVAAVAVPVADAAGAVPVAGGGITIPVFSSEAERAETREARAEALPVFLKAAEEGIADAAEKLDTARTRGAPAEEIAALAERLDTMRRVREQVLARNNDIRG